MRVCVCVCTKFVADNDSDINFVHEKVHRKKIFFFYIVIRDDNCENYSKIYFIAV